MSTEKNYSYQGIDSIKLVLKSKVSRYNSITELNGLLEDINTQIKDFSLNADDLLELERIRQRVYEKKSKIRKLQDCITETSEEGSASPEENVVKGRKKQLIIPILLLIFFAALLIIQSNKIYIFLGMDFPFITALGGVLMVVGLSFYSKKGAYVSNIFIFIYEISLILGGTIYDEELIQNNLKKSGLTYQTKEEKYERYKNDYKLLEVKYYDKASKLYQNTWYKKTFLDPAWIKMEEASESLIQEDQKTVWTSQVCTILFLKVLYRFGIILTLFIIMQEIQIIFRR